MKRKAMLPFMTSRRAKPCQVEIYLGDNPNQFWSDFVEGCEEAVAYMLIQENATDGGLDGFQKTYDKFLSKKSVTVTVDAEVWAAAQITFVMKIGKSFRYLTDCSKNDILNEKNELSVRKGGGVTAKGKPVDTEAVEEPCLRLFKQLLLGLGYAPTSFGFDDDMPEETKAGEGQLAEVSESETVTDEAERQLTLDEIAEMVIIPDKIPDGLDEKAKRNFVPLLAYLSSIGNEGRNQYVGNLNRFAAKINGYIEKVINASNDLDGMAADGDVAEEMVTLMLKAGYSEDLMKAVLEQLPSSADKQAKTEDKSKTGEGPVLEQAEPVSKEVSIKKYYNFLLDLDTVDDDAIPERIKMYAEDDVYLSLNKLNQILSDANVCYSDGPSKGSLVQFKG